MINNFNFSSFKGIIGVIGSGSGNLDKKIYETAEILGEIIAREKYILACGGLFGIMEAVCKGAKNAQGFTIGFIPGLEKKSANDFIDLVIPTGMGEARNLILVSTSDIIISIAGESGTLSELAFAWKMGKSIISLQNTGGWSAKLADEKIDNTRKDHIYSAQNPKDAISLVKKLLENKKIAD